MKRLVDTQITLLKKKFDQSFGKELLRQGSLLSFLYLRPLQGLI